MRGFRVFNEGGIRGGHRQSRRAVGRREGAATVYTFAADRGQDILIANSKIVNTNFVFNTCDRRVIGTR